MAAGRRRFLKGSLGVPGAVAAGTAANTAKPQEDTGSLRAGSFPVYNVHAGGATPDGTSLNTPVFQQTIDKAGADGGGVVYVPPGDYLIGTIALRQNVTLYLEAGATLWASKNRRDCQHGCLIYAEDVSNAALRGRGVVDGNGKAFWRWEQGRWRIGEWRPSRLLQFVRCENLLLEDITLRNSPAWTVHPIDCDRVTIRGISILNGLDAENHGPNTDGIDPDGCTKVRISDCYVQSADDCIVLKITDRPGGNKFCRDITVTNCVLITRESALKIGSETYGEFRNISFSNCAIRDAGCGVGLWMRDGGLIDGWVVDNISMTLTGGGQPIYMTSYPRSRLGEPGAPRAEEVPPGVARNVMISNVTAEADGCIFLSGMEEKPLEGIALENIRIHMRGSRKKELHRDPPYPFPVWGHRRSPYDIFCRYVDGLSLRNVRLTWNTPEQAEWGSAIRCLGVRRLELDGINGRQALGSESAAIWLRSTKDVFIHNCWAPEGTGVFLKADSGTENVALMGNDLSRATKVVEFSAGVDSKAVFDQGNREPAS